MDSVFVYADWQGLGGPILMGILSSTYNKGQSLFSFAYDEQWLRSGHSQILDPELQFYQGQQYPSADRQNFGLFMDSLPDRWGRVLMDRREFALAKNEDRKARALNDLDYLLAIDDTSRMGAIRIKLDPEGPFVSSDKTMVTPPLRTLRDLQFAASKMEGENFFQDPDMNKWIQILVDPASSLGGARPKSNVVNDNNELWIAKFPSRNDRVDKGAWEFLTWRLANDSGVHMAPSRLDHFGGDYQIFLTQRFDRRGEKRIHYASAMTLLGKQDGAEGSYLELVDFLKSQGAQTKQDLEQLFTRIAFTVAVKNTDDHLRNHGFLLTPQGWILSPAFDINPEPNGIRLRTAIDEADRSLDPEVIRSVHHFFQLSSNQCDMILDHVRKTVASYRDIAKELKIPSPQVELMGNCFLHQA